MGIRHGFGLWLQPITMDRGWSRETFRAGHRSAEPGLGPGRPGRRPVCRPVWRLPRAVGRRAALRAGAGGDGAGHLGPGLQRHRRAFDRHRAGRHHLCGGLWRDRPQRGGREALLGDGRHRRRRLVRSVPDGAGGELADQCLGLAERAVRAGLHGAGDRALGARPEGAAVRGACGTVAEHRRRAARGLRLPQLPMADGGIFRLWLPGGVHRRAHAQLPEGPWPGARRGHHRAGADRPVQRLRHLCRGARWASACPSATS